MLLSQFLTPGDIGPTAGTPLSQFSTPGDIGPLAAIPSRLGLKRVNYDFPIQSQRSLNIGQGQQKRKEHTHSAMTCLC